MFSAGTLAIAFPPAETEVGSPRDNSSACLPDGMCRPRVVPEMRSPDTGAMPKHGKPSRVVLDHETRSRLARQARSTTAPHRIVLRSRIILLLEKLGSDGQVARDLQVTSRTVRRWRERFVGGGTDALWRDAPGRGRKTSRRPDVDGAVAEYLGRKQRGDVVPSLRALARSLGIGLGSVHRLLTRPRRSGD